MALEHPLVEQLGLLVPTLGDVFSGGLVGHDDHELLDAVERLGQIRRLVDVLGAELAGEVNRRCHEGALAARHGEKSAAALVSVRSGIELDEARAWVAAGEATAPRSSIFGERLEAQRPELARALTGGKLSVGAAAQIADALDELERRARGPVPGAEQALIEHAPVLTRRQLRVLCRSLLDQADADGVELREEELRRRSGLEISRTADGLLRWVVTMHPEAAGFLTAALDARTAPRREPRFVDAEQDPSIDTPEDVDSRTLTQRRLDALVSIARESLEHDPGHVAGTAVTMLVTVPLEALRSGLGAAQLSGIDAPISAKTARRLAAQAEIIPVVLGGPSEPLDLGHPVRLFSSAQRRAIEIRDGGCLWPGCAAPPGWCEAAHVDPWAAGGKTDLANAILLCPFHHRRFDNDGWSLDVRGGVRCLIPPGWVDASRRPRFIAPRGVGSAA